MNDLPESLFVSPVRHALQSRHRHLAVSAGEACRYPAEVAPFAAVAASSTRALEDLHSLLSPGEWVWLFGVDYPRAPELSAEETLACLQMVFDATAMQAASRVEIVRLTDANADEMVALTDVAFPGFFRVRTCEMGAYFGVRSEGELIAMGGERLMLDGYSEISGICTHPSHRRKGIAAGIIAELLRNHRREGVVSWLHVTADNHHAIELYRRMGFRPVRQVLLTRVLRA